MKKAAMLWTGGKDSALALHEAATHGYQVTCLVTFAPKERGFLAHPLPVMACQAQSIGLPHHVLTISAPFEKSYEAALRHLQDDYNVDAVITGDIAEVNSQPNWITSRCQAVGMSTCLPLWGRDRETLLQRMRDCGFRIKISCVDTRKLDISWLGRELDALAINELRAISMQNNLDLCGENGEYHTMAIDGPIFTQPINIGTWTTAHKETLAYMQWQ